MISRLTSVFTIFILSFLFLAGKLFLYDSKSINTYNNTLLSAYAQSSKGFLTWPFSKRTKYRRKDYLGRDSVFDRNPAQGQIEAYDPSIPKRCTGSVCVVDGHTGIDIGVDAGTVFVAAAPLRITGFTFLQGRRGKKVGVIHVDYENGYTGRYAHARLSRGIKIGDSIRRGQPFGFVERSDVGAAHLHFEILKSGIPVDPYDSITHPTGISLWTIYNKPQYDHE